MTSNFEASLGLGADTATRRGAAGITGSRSAGAADVAAVLLVGRLPGSLGHLLRRRAGCLRALLRRPLRILDALLLAFTQFPNSPTRIHLIAMWLHKRRK